MANGEVGLVEVIDSAIEHLGQDDPFVRWLLAMQFRIARGDPGYRGRYIGIRAKEASRLADRILGKPVQRLEHGGKVTLEQLVTQSLPDKARG